MRFQNQMRDVYRPGHDLTCHASSDVTGKTFAAIAGPRRDNVPTVDTETAAGRVFGVFKYSADEGDLVGIARGSGRVVTVTAGATMSAGTEVQAGPDGHAVPLDAGTAAGVLIDDADTGDDALVTLL